MQLQFKLPEINREATKNAVESVFEQYHMYLMQTDLNKLPSITAKYTLMPVSMGLPSSSTENAAIANVDYDIERTTFMNHVMRAVNRLPQRERALIITRYMSDDVRFDYEAFEDLFMSERTYYRLKSHAFYSLAFSLKIEVYEESKEVEAS